MHPMTLIGIHEKDQQGIRRFRSKSASKNETKPKIKI